MIPTDRDSETHRSFTTPAAAAEEPAAQTASAAKPPAFHSLQCDTSPTKNNVEITTAALATLSRQQRARLTNIRLDRDLSPSEKRLCVAIDRQLAQSADDFVSAAARLAGPLRDKCREADGDLAFVTVACLSRLLRHIESLGR